MTIRISHFRQADERGWGDGRGTDGFAVARRPSVEVSCASVWNVGVRGKSIFNRSVGGNIIDHTVVSAPRTKRKTATVS
jgi:hypothetical protein